MSAIDTATTATVLPGAATASSTGKASSTTGSSKSGTATTKTTLGKQDFLNLLITQLRYQNPLSPEDPQEFVAQLAQFSSLEQLTNLNDKMDSFSTLIKSNQTTAQVSQGVALLGKNVKAAGNTIMVTGSQANDASYWLGAAAASVKVGIYDAGGNLVRTLNLGNQSSGENTLSWDGKNDAGQQVADGTYTFQVTATDSKGTAVDVTTFFTGQVTEVLQDTANNKVYLKVNGRLITIDQIIAIDQTA